MTPQLLEERSFALKPQTQRLILFMIVMTSMMWVLLWRPF